MSDVSVRCVDWLLGVRSLRPASVDMLYADPPFATQRRHSGRRGVEASFDDRWESTGAYIAYLRERLEASVPALKRSACVLLHVDQTAGHRVRLMLDEVLGPDRFVNHLIWHYGLGGSSPRAFARKHDDIYFYCIDPDAYWFEPPMVPATSARLRGKQKKSTDVIRFEDVRHAADVLEVPSINNMAGERTGYPTQKPRRLLDMLVRACCPPGGVVLDPCCGSGTTLEAALAAGRCAVGFDVSPAAIEVCGNRLARTGQFVP